MDTKLPLIDKEKLTTISIYKDILDYIKENIPGKNDPERLYNMTKFYSKNYGLTPLEMMDDNLKQIFADIARKIKDE